MDIRNRLSLLGKSTALVRYIVILTLLSIVGCKRVQPPKKNADAGSKFERQAFFDWLESTTLVLISPTACEFQPAEAAPILLGEYTREGNNLRIVMTAQGSVTVTYFEIGEDEITDTQTHQSLRKMADPDQPRLSIREMATRILEDLRLIDAAADQWALERNKTKGDPVSAKDIAPYLKQGSPLQKACAEGHCVDLLGNPIDLGTVDSGRFISYETYDLFSSIVPIEFWGQFISTSVKASATVEKWRREIETNE